MSSRGKECNCCSCRYNRDRYNYGNCNNLGLGQDIINPLLLILLLNNANNNCRRY